MSVVAELALLLSRSTRSRLLPNKSIGLNIVAIAAGVAFVAFALAIYDGYRSNVERIIFSLTPHVMVRPGLRLAPDAEDAQDESATCLKVCRAPFAVHLPQGEKRTTAAALDDRKVEAITRWLAANAPAGTSASRVLFEEAKLEIHSTTFASEGVRVMRLLGVERLYGEEPAPRIDLTFSDAAVAERFRRAAGILISDTLADEIARADGTPVVPGRSTIRIGPPGKLHEVQVAGIHHLGIHSISRNLIIAPYRLAAELLGEEGKLVPTYVGVTLADANGARDLGDRLRRGLRAEELAAVPWQSVSDLFDQLELYRRIIFVALSLAILVTAINTFVNINILIMERVEEIGIMRAMGLSPGRLLSVFAAVALIQSIVGATLGYGLGISIGYVLDDYINSLVRDFVPITEAKIVPDPLVYSALLAFVTLLSVGTCLWAARRALKSAIFANLRGA